MAYLRSSTANDVIPLEVLTHRNIMINGGMQVWQRATATITATTSNYPTADRWHHVDQSGGTFTSEQDALTPADKGTTGQAFALELNVTGADGSVASGDYCKIEQVIEGKNLQHINYGSAQAKDLVLSFWVKSNKTGTYGVNLQKQTNTTYYCIRTYTIDIADTWEKKVLIFSATAGGTTLITSSPGEIDDTIAEGMRLAFWLMGGTNYHVTEDNWSTGGHTTSAQTNWMDSTSNNFYITGVQLEVGSTATPFEHRSFADELLRCQRYCIVLDQNYRCFPGRCYGGATVDASIPTFPVEMRTTPTHVQQGTAAIGSFFMSDGSNDTATINSTDWVHASKTGGMVRYVTAGGITNGPLTTQTGANSWEFNAEL